MKNLQKKIIRLGKFLRILDGESNLSITNILVIIMVIKFAFAPMSTVDFGILLSSIVGYQFKRFTRK